MISTLPGHVPLLVATRGGRVESVHYGSVAVCDPAGVQVAGAGDTGFPVFTRSTLKPFQALPFVLAGGPEHFGFSEEQAALLCASHSGEPRHLAAVADMLAKAGCSEAQLQCGSHVPTFYAATGRTPPPDLALRPLHHNCSGKHAGFLAWCRLKGAPLESYLDRDHPLQQEIRRTVAELAGCGEASLPWGIDGCSAPNYALPLSRLAAAYARLAAGGNGPWGPALACLFRAMVGHPEMVSGEGRADLELMAAAPGDWVAKGGAEAVQALGIASRRLGIAIKISDGGSRALQAVTAAVLEQLGLVPGGSENPLRDEEREQIVNQAGRETGRLMPVFELG